MRNFFSKMLSSDKGTSSKRFITLMAFVLMGAGFITNLFWGLKIEEFIYESMKWIVIGGLGFTASEQFGTKSKDITPKDKNDSEEEST